MKRRVLSCRAFGLAVCALALIVPAAGCDSTTQGGPRDDSGSSHGLDSDGDGISDEWEGASERVDTDGDGTPDYLDDDSDGDGIPDSIEGFVAPTTGEPVDSDSDGTPDFRDLDSDDNGIPDSAEIDDDLDEDGHPGFRDHDDDGDRLDDRVEIGGTPAAPSDMDRDGVPDYRDIDSDNDTIADMHESTLDSDEDGVLDRFDSDSDDDGYGDAEEAGDADPLTPPIDSDNDLVPDYRDADSDNDGLSDADERALGTNPRNADTDGDGVSDLIEFAACPDREASCANDATDPSSSPRTRGDFVFLTPYMMPPVPESDTLDFATDIRIADVYFLIDTTASMGGAIRNVQASLSRTDGIIDRVRARIPEVWFGVGGFDDYPVCTYGSGGDRAYYHVTDLTGDAATAQAGVNTLMTHSGGDRPESAFAAAWSAATGNGLAGTSGWTQSRSASSAGACPVGRFGWPCFRTDAVPIIVLITDVDVHNGPGGTSSYDDACVGGYTPRYYDVVTELVAANIRVIGVAVRGGGSADLSAIARDTGAVDSAGSALVSTASDGSVSDTIVTQIETLASSTTLDISLQYVDDRSDSVNSFAAFVSHIEANTTGDPGRGCEPRDAIDGDLDGHFDTFPNITAGARVCFDIVVKQNETVMPTSAPQMFRATLRVLGDNFTELDKRDVHFLVPGIVEGPGAPH